MIIDWNNTSWNGNLFFRQVTRRTGASVSYKEESEEETHSEDLMDVDEAAATAEPDNAETIERILAQRIGKKGGRFYYRIKLSIQ